MKTSISTSLRQALMAAFAVSGLCSITTAQATTVELGRVVFVGDSITHGSSGYGPSYRYDLWKSWVDNGYTYNAATTGLNGSNYTFLGSMTGPAATGGLAVTPNYAGAAFTNRHEGHFNWQAAELSGRVAVSTGNDVAARGEGTVQNWLGLATTYQNASPSTKTYTKTPYAAADTLFVMLGTNDLAQSAGYVEANIVGDVTTIINAYLSVNANTQVYLMSVLPTDTSANGARVNSRRDSYNASLAAYAATQANVTYIDASKGFVAVGMLQDWAHPNAQGELIIAGNIAKTVGTGQRTVGLTRQLAGNGTTFTANKVVAGKPTTGAGLIVTGTEWTQKVNTATSANYYDVRATNQINTLAYSWSSAPTGGFGAEVTVQLYNGVASNQFSVAMGNGAQYGLFTLTADSIYWGGTAGTLLYSYTGTNTGADTGFSSDFRFSYIDSATATTNGTTAGYYLWYDGMLIGEALSSTVGTQYNGLTIGNLSGTTTSFAGVQSISLASGGAYAPQVESGQFVKLTLATPTTPIVLPTALTSKTPLQYGFGGAATNIANQAAVYNPASGYYSTSASFSNRFAGRNGAGNLYVEFGNITMSNGTVGNRWISGSSGSSNQVNTASTYLKFTGSVTATMVGSFTSVTAVAGTFAILGGSFGETTLAGDTFIEIASSSFVCYGMFNSSTTGAVFGGNWTGTVTGNTNILISAGTFGNGVETFGFGAIYGGGSGGSAVNGNANITITGGVFNSWVAGGGYSSGTVVGSTNIYISGGTFNKVGTGASQGVIAGGGQNGAVGSTNILIDYVAGNTLQINTDIYAGSRGTGAVTGDAVVSFRGFLAGSTIAGMQSTQVVSGTSQSTGTMNGTEILQFIGTAGELKAQIRSFDRVLVNGNSDVRLSGAFTSIGTLEIENGSIVTIAGGAKSVTGVLGEAGSTLAVESALTVSGNAAMGNVTMGAGSSLALKGTSNSIAGTLTVSGASTVTGTVSVNNTVLASDLTIAAGAIATVMGAVTGTGKVTVVGTLINTDGTVNAAIEIGSGGKLQGAGNFGNSITVLGGGTHVVGNSPGHIDLGAANTYSVESGGTSTYYVTSDTDYSQMSAGTFSLETGAIFSLKLDGFSGLNDLTFANPLIWDVVLFNALEIDGIATTLDDANVWLLNHIDMFKADYGLALISAQFVSTTGDSTYGSALQLRYVPEPTTATLGILGLAGLLLRRRRRA